MKVSFCVAIILKAFITTILQKRACSIKPIALGVLCGAFAVAIDLFTLHALPIVVYISAEALPIIVGIVYESVWGCKQLQTKSGPTPDIHPLLPRWAIVLLLLLTSCTSIFTVVENRDDVESWWDENILVYVLVVIQLSIVLISTLSTFKENHTYKCVDEENTTSKDIQVWSKNSQLSRIARIGFCGTVMSISAQAFLSWLLIQDFDHVEFNDTVVLFMLLGITSLPYFARFKRESYRPDFYFGMLGMMQLFSWSCISIIDNAFIHHTEWHDYVAPIVAMLVLLLAVF